MAAPDLQAMFDADMAQAIARRRDASDEAMARQRDGAAYDMRALGAVITSELVRSDDPAQIAALNAGIRTPLTVSQPGNV